MASPNLSEIVTTTLRNRSKKLADNVTNHNALLRRLKERGNVDLADGGRTIVQELEYAENTTLCKMGVAKSLLIDLEVPAGTTGRKLDFCLAA